MVSSLRERFGPRLLLLLLLLLLLRFPLALLPPPLLKLFTPSFMSSFSELFSELDRFILARFSIKWNQQRGKKTNKFEWLVKISFQWNSVVVKGVGDGNETTCLEQMKRLISNEINFCINFLSVEHLVCDCVVNLMIVNAWIEFALNTEMEWKRVIAIVIICYY